MNVELIINSTQSETIIALLEDKKLVELHKDTLNNKITVGDIFIGKINKILPGLNSAFVDIGFGKDAFLHYSDLGPQFLSFKKFTEQLLSYQGQNLNLENFTLEPEIDKAGSITNVLSPNQNILVQIVKEPISTKGPKLSAQLTLAGRYLVLLPFSNKISVSRRIRSREERQRLKILLQSIKPNNFGVIIRTVAENVKVADLHSDLNELLEKWNSAFQNFSFKGMPKKVIGEVNRTSTFLRDMLNASFSRIYVNDLSLYKEIKEYLKIISPAQEDIVKLYKLKIPIFEFFKIDKQIKSLFGKNVTTDNGVNLVIEHTEACHVIDINSGHHTSQTSDLETTAFEVNMEAAVEVARQLRLRDMGGIIIVDFINMRNKEHRKNLYLKLKEEMMKDKAKHNILPPTKLGLVQITRERIRPEVNIMTDEQCPTCGGTGKIKPSILFIEELENKIKYIVNSPQYSSEKRFILYVHPIIKGYLEKGLLSIKNKWLLKYKRWISIKSSQDYHFLEYHFFNSKEEEIKI